MKTEFNIVLKEKPHDEGLTKAEVMDLYDMLSGVEAIPIEIQGEYSTAMGFINLTDAEFMNYDYSNLESYIQEILNDMEKENEDCEYQIDTNCGYSTIYMSR